MAGSLVPLKRKFQSRTKVKTGCVTCRLVGSRNDSKDGADLEIGSERSNAMRKSHFAGDVSTLVVPVTAMNLSLEL